MRLLVALTTPPIDVGRTIAAGPRMTSTGLSPGVDGNEMVFMRSEAPPALTIPDPTRLTSGPRMIGRLTRRRKSSQ
jgi:hypothetical protein